MDKEQKNKLTYIIYCVNAFGERYNLRPKQAYIRNMQYMMQFFNEYNKDLTSVKSAEPLIA